MKKATRQATALIALLLASTQAGAPISGLFTGLSDLIASSEHIVVATVLTAPPAVRASSFDDAQPQEIQVFHVLKGTIEPKTRLMVGLRTRSLINEQDFGVLERYVLFLRRYEPKSYALVNVPGSALWVAPTSKLSDLPASDIRGSITTLLREAVAYRKQQQAAIENRVDEYLASP